MTHLHFDHCGGCIQWNKDRTGYESAFKNASFWTNKNHWEWATKPNPREKASFLKENLIPMEQSGHLNFINLPNTKNNKAFQETSELNFGIHFVDGHTEKQMLPQLQYKGKTIVYVADLIPTVGHIPLPYVIGYDTRPLLTMTEKELFLNQAVENNFYLFFEHDAHHELCTLKKTEKGVRLDTTYSFNEVFN